MSTTSSQKILNSIAIGVSSLAVVMSTQMTQAQAASLTFNGSGTNSATNNTLGASVIFNDQLNPGKLTVNLKNTGSSALAPSDVLTAVFWEYNGTSFSGLVLDSATAPTVIGGTPGTNVNLKTLNEWKLPNTGNGTTNLPGITQNYGLGTAGFNIFQGGGGQQFNYGLISGFNPSANNPNFKPSASQVGTFVKDSATFVLSGLPSTFDINKISSIRFQYGTALSEPSFTGALYTPPPPPPKKVPEPAATSALGLFALGAVRLLKKKVKSNNWISSI
ncbi:PEP-CTERM sorting domain-containing protein [Anabaena sp. UHCC 0187]|uniref:XDD4 family exosortase-dependent surface protein n=1 Tax=Anabaena sp. UHCC 0187 TaxID=2590018 RepID=UPI00144891B1|nr:XDD4 family exosortase-dependent surface protein [Anabaena sp. UHCC 0187]MDP5018831.1 PEP-CTERM sorting domain-containing protein [Dolichospermum sp.]MTJ13853.1 PEP-CTERM sorting domain-containing protein [Anabaena sp. UHCC 0187]